MAIVLFLIPIIGCSDTQPIKIGFVAALSGRKSQLGIDGRNSVQLAITQLNEAGGIKGRKLELIVKDNEGDPKRNGQVINELMAEGVPFIIGPMISLMAETTLQVIDGKDVLLFSPSMSTSYLSGRDDNLLRSVPSTQGQGRDLAKLALSLGDKSAISIIDLGNKRYTEGVASAFAEYFTEGQGKIHPVLTIGDDTPVDYEVITRTVMQQNPDGVVLSMSAIDAAFTAQQLMKAGYDAHLYSPSWALSNDLYEQGGTAVENLYLVTETRREDKSDMERFNKAYNEMYNKDASFLGSLAYDSIQIMLEGLKNAPDQTPAAVKKWLLTHKDFAGVERDIHLDDYGDPVIDHMVLQIQNGKFEEVR
ncbi:MAG: ABC transporter substrate-binding protein [Pseudodesulfovibrio sp.]